MRVLYLNPAGCLGGAERSLLTLIAGLRTRPGIDCRLLTTAAGPIQDEARALGIESTVVPLPAGLARLGESGSPAASVVAAAILRTPGAAAYVVRLRRLLDDWRPDILHTNGLKAHVLGAAAKPPSARLIWHLHDYVSRRTISRRLLRVASGRCDAAVAVSESVARDARGVLPGVPVHTVENGIDLQRFTPEGPTADLDELAGAPPVDHGTVRVGLVATYATWKGHDIFLRALTRVGHLPVQAYVVGGPVYDTADSQWRQLDLQHLADEIGVRSRVRFVPFCPDIAPIMRALDVVVHASTAPEPFGLVIAEAMCTGRTVIVSAGGGAADLVRPGVDALTHAPGDVAGLAEAIERLASDPGARLRLATAARDAGGHRFSHVRVADNMRRIYDLTLGPGQTATDRDS